MDQLIQNLMRAGVLVVVIFIALAVVIPQCLRILREYERGVIFRLGKLIGAKGPGVTGAISVLVSSVSAAAAIAFSASSYLPSA